MNKFSAMYLIRLMDSTSWVRLSVCVLPGIVISKMAGQVEALGFLALPGMLVMFLGIAIYSFWNRIKDKLLNEQSHEAGIDSADQDLVSIEHIAALCNGNFEQAVKVVSVEAKLNPLLSYQEAVNIAYKRLASATTSHI